MTSWYVAPAGTAGNAGTISSPWSLTFAGAGAGGLILPGDTVWMRGGIYNDPAAATTNNAIMYHITVDGTAGNPVTFRGYPGELAVLSDHRGEAETARDLWLLYVSGEYVDARDFVTRCTYTVREQTLESFMTRGGTIACVSPHGHLINVIGHDGLQGVFFGSGAANAHLIGGVFYNYGSKSPLQGSGHAVYTQSADGDTKEITDCVFAGGYGYNLHAYTTLDANLDGFTVTDCTSIDGRILKNLSQSLTGNPTPGGGDQWGGSSGGGPITNLAIDGHFHDSGLVVSDPNDYPDEIRVRDSYFLAPHVAGAGITQLRGITNLREFSGNTVWRYNTADDPPVIDMQPANGTGNVTTLTPASPSDIDGNAYYLKDSAQRAIKNPAATFRTLAQWRADTGYDLTSTVDYDGSGPPDLYDVVVNPEETGRGTVRIFKAAATATMAVNLDTVLSTGQQFWLYDARNPLDGAFASGTYTTGTPVTVTFADMPGRAIPVGWSSAPVGNQATHPVVIVRRVGPAWVAPPFGLTAPRYRYRVVLT